MGARRASITPEQGADRANEIRQYLGLPPERPSSGGSIVIAGTSSSDTAVSGIKEYTDDMVSTVRILLPKLQPIIAGTQQLTRPNLLDAEAIAALDAVFEATPRVALWTYGPLSESVQARLDALARRSPRRLFVLSAGNHPSED
jgi:hypothetical protein